MIFQPVAAATLMDLVYRHHLYGIMKTPDVSFNKNFPPSRTDDSRVASSACSWGVTWTVEFATTCLRYVSDLNLFSDFSTTGDSRGLEVYFNQPLSLCRGFSRAAMSMSLRLPDQLELAAVRYTLPLLQFEEVFGGLALVFGSRVLDCRLLSARSGFGCDVLSATWGSGC